MLIIEDSLDIQDPLRQLFESEGYDVEIAKHGAEALEFLKSSVVLLDVILLDLMMPVMNGFDFRSAQMKHPLWRRIPTVAMTANAATDRYRSRAVNRFRTVSKTRPQKTPARGPSPLSSEPSEAFAAIGEKRVSDDPDFSDSIEACRFRGLLGDYAGCFERICRGERIGELPCGPVPEARLSDETSLDRLLRLYSILREGMSALLADKQASHAVHAELHPWLDRERRRVMAVYVHRSEPWDNGYCRGWYDYTGGTPETHLGSGRMQSVHPEDKAGAQCVFERADASRSAFSLDLRLWRSDGVYRWVTDSGVPRFDSRGRFLGFVGSVEDNHDRKIAEQSLKEALRVRDEFLSVASHELKTPLTSLKLLAQRAQRLLAHGGGLASENATEVFVRLLVQTNRSVERLSRLVDDMLDVSSIASGRLALRTEKMDLGAVVQDVVERLRPPSHGSLGSLGSAPHRARRGFGRLRRAWARPLHRETNRRAPRRANSSPQRAR